MAAEFGQPGFSEEQEVEKNRVFFPITWHRLDFSGEIVAKTRGNSFTRGSNPANLSWLNTLLPTVDQKCVRRCQK